MRRKAHSWGMPPWTVDYRPAPRALPDHVDFAIVGAGFSGLSAAAWLRRMAPGRSVLVLESAALGDGASGRTGGMALAETAAGPLPGKSRGPDCGERRGSRVGLLESASVTHPPQTPPPHPAQRNSRGASTSRHQRLFREIVRIAGCWCAQTYLCARHCPVVLGAAQSHWPLFSPPVLHHRLSLFVGTLARFERRHLWRRTRSRLCRRAFSRSYRCTFEQKRRA